MDNHENTVAAGGGMSVEETQVQNEEVKASELMQDGGAQGGEAQEEKAQTSQDGQVKAYTEGIAGLYDMGWTQEEVAALIADPDALRDIRDGKTIGQAAHAYMRRQMQAASAEKPTERTEPAHRRGVPTMKKGSGAARSAGSRIDELSSEEFARLRKRAEKAMMEGKLVSFD